MNTKETNKNISDTPDKKLTASHPTAISDEFVPLPLDNIKDALHAETDSIFDFIPNPKNIKYK